MNAADSDTAGANGRALKFAFPVAEYAVRAQKRHRFGGNVHPGFHSTATTGEPGFTHPHLDATACGRPCRLLPDDSIPGQRPQPSRRSADR